MFNELGETIKIAFDAIRTSKLRSMLASLGVVIGISFVILMGWILTGLDNAMQDTFDMIGTDMLYIDKHDWAGGSNWKEMRQRKDITLNQAKDFCERIESAEIAVPVIRTWRSQMKYEGQAYQASFIGTPSEHSIISSKNIASGRFFTGFEDKLSANVIVIGHKIAETVFPNDEPVGKIIKIKGRKLEIIGVMKKQGTMMMDFVDLQCYVPIKKFMSIYGRDRSFEIAVKAGSEEKLDEVRDEAQGLFREIRNLKPWAKDDFSINETKAFEKSVETIRAYVWSIGLLMTGLSFIVGIIGIINIMFVSVTERTKEIGVRKAVGAKKRSIWLQFIIESAVLCFSGALISLILCSALVFAVATFLPKSVPEVSFLSPTLSYELLITASIVSIVVGVVAGLIPAVRAANMDPVIAIRSD